MSNVTRFEVIDSDDVVRATRDTFDDAADVAAVIRDDGDVVRVQPEGDAGAVVIIGTVSPDEAAAFAELVALEGGDARSALQRMIWSALEHVREDAARDRFVAEAARRRLTVAA